MRQKISIVAAILLLLSARLVQGFWVDPTNNAQALDEAVARLDNVTMTLGPWLGETLPPLDPGDIAGAKLSGYLWRCYHNTLTGDKVSVLLLCGRPGPLAVHTPDVCYQGAGYDAIETPTLFTVSPPALGQPATFWMSQFRKSRSAAPDEMRIYWSWKAKGTWEAVDRPRLTFAGLPFLYKLYVIGEVSQTKGKTAKAPDQELMDLLLPELQQTLR